MPSPSPSTSISDRPFEPQEAPAFPSLSPNPSGNYHDFSFRSGSTQPGQSHFFARPPAPGVAEGGLTGYTPAGYNYRPQEETASPFNQQHSFGAQNSPLPGGQLGANPQYWGYANSPTVEGNPSFSSNASLPPHNPPHSPAFGYQQRGDSVWQQARPPPRSVSYGHIEGHHAGPSHYASAFQPAHGHGQQQPPPHFPPSPMDMRHTNIMGHELGSRAAGPQMAYGQLDPSQYIFPSGHPQHSPMGPPLSPQPMYPSNWYGSSSFGPQEEEHSPENPAQRPHHPG